MFQISSDCLDRSFQMPYIRASLEQPMPWKKQFDVDEARKKAKAFFWNRGYEATSMDDLLQSMGINRGSFYATFGSKREVYTDVLRRYDQEHRHDVLERLKEGNSPREAILALFDGVRAEASGRGGTKGCFLANATLELAASDKAVAGIVREAFAETEEFFQKTIQEGQRTGEIRRGLDSRATARSLLGLLLGMRVLARAGVPAAVLESITLQVAEMV